MGNFLVCGGKKDNIVIVRKAFHDTRQYSSDDISIDFCDGVCGICLVNQKNKETQCKKCGYGSCASCAREWIQTLNNKDLRGHCPICKCSWNSILKYKIVVEESGEKFQPISENIQETEEEEYQQLPRRPSSIRFRNSIIA